MRVDLEPKDDFMEIEFNGQKCLIKELKDLVYTDIDGVPNGEPVKIATSMYEYLLNRVK